MSPYARAGGGTGSARLDWHIQTYVDARLTPSPDAVRRMRNALVVQATAAAALRELEAQSLETARRRQMISLVFSRRVAAAALAASLVVGSSAAVLAATPGSAFYPIRLWVEGATLPTSDDARAAVHVSRLELRLEELERALRSHDPNAVAAALAAYQAEVAAAVEDAGADTARLARLEAALGIHAIVLETLEEDATEVTSPAVKDAIDASHKAQTDIQRKRDSGKPKDAPTRD